MPSFGYGRHHTRVLIALDRGLFQIAVQSGDMDCRGWETGRPYAQGWRSLEDDAGSYPWFLRAVAATGFCVGGTTCYVPFTARGAHKDGTSTISTRRYGRGRRWH